MGNNIKNKQAVQGRESDVQGGGTFFTTAQWVDKDFGGNLATTNQSSQEVPS